MLTQFGLLYPYGNNISEKVWAIVYYQVAGSPEPYDDNGNSPTLLKKNSLIILGTGLHLFVD